MESEKINHLFDGPLKIINLGLESFADNLKDRDVRVMRMAWHPPAGGNEKMLDLLKRLEKIKGGTQR